MTRDPHALDLPPREDTQPPPVWWQQPTPQIRVLGHHDRHAGHPDRDQTDERQYR